MTVYKTIGNNVYVEHDRDSVPTSRTLEPAIYQLAFADKIGYYLTKIDDVFDIPKRVYGKSNETMVNHIFSVFNNQPTSMGAMFIGNQGSGKTLLAKNLSNCAINNNIPVILITSCQYGDAFNRFMSSIEQEVLVLFEEFEKYYDNQDQEKLLTLFDGVYTEKKLWIITANSSNSIVSTLKNRPSRMRYAIKFYGLEPSIVDDYCHDHLNNMALLPSIKSVFNLYGELFNFDMLQILVSELNLFPNQSIKHALDILNFDQPMGRTCSIIDFSVNGIPVGFEPKHKYRNIFNETTEVCCFIDRDIAANILFENTKESHQSERTKSFYADKLYESNRFYDVIDASNIKGMDANTGIITFEYTTSISTLLNNCDEDFTDGLNVVDLVFTVKFKPTTTFIYNLHDAF